MSFAGALKLNQLPEKPWQTGAVARFGAAVLVSMMMLGGLTTVVVRYFETPQTSSVIWFLILAKVGFASTVGAIVMLFRSWSRAERYLFNLILLLTCIYAGIACIWLTQRLIHGKIELQNPVLAMLIAIGAFQGFTLLTVSFFLRQHHTGWREGFGLSLRPGQALLIGITVGILVLYPILKLNEIFFNLFEKLTLHPQEQQAVEILRHTEGLLGRIASGIATVLIAPLGEEIIFRGILYPWAKRFFSTLFRGAAGPVEEANASSASTQQQLTESQTLGLRKYSQPAALWGTAILFGAIHLNLSSFVPLTLLAAVLVCLYEYTGNLLAPIAVHCIFNGVNFVLLFHQQQ